MRAAVLRSKFVVGVGVNCSKPEFCADLIRIIVREIESTNSECPVLCYPNLVKFGMREAPWDLAVS